MITHVRSLCLHRFDKSGKLISSEGDQAQANIHTLGEEELGHVGAAANTAHNYYSIFSDAYPFLSF